MEASNLAAKGIAHCRGITKHTANQGKSSGRIPIEQFGDNYAGKMSQFNPRAGKNPSRDCIPRICHLGYRGKKAGKIRVGVYRPHKLIDRALVPNLHKRVEQWRGAGAGIQRKQRFMHRSSANPMRRTFIRNGEAPAARPCGPSREIAAIGNRTGSGNHNYPGAIAEGGLQRDGHVADNHGLAR